MKPTLWSTIAISAVCVTISPISASDTSLPYPTTTGVALGNGWDIPRGEKTSSSCVEAGEVRDPGQRLFVRYAEVSDQSSLSQAFSMSTSGNVQLGIASGGVSASASRSFNLTMTGLNHAVQAQILHGPKFLVPIGTEVEAQRRLQANAATSSGETIGVFRNALVSSGDRAIRFRRRYAEMSVRRPARFRRECGDAFVSMIGTASGIEGVVTATTRSEEERMAVNASFRGSYGPAGGEAAVSATMARLASQSRIAVEYIQLGGQGLPIAISPDEFRTLIRDLGVRATEISAPPNRMAVTPYSELPNYGGREGEYVEMERMANQYLRLIHLGQYLTDATTNTERYYFDNLVTIQSVRDVETDVRRALNTLETSLRACADRPASCRYPNVPKTDWSYRVKLPIPMQEATAYNDLQAAITALAQAQEQRTHYPENDRDCGGAFNDDCEYRPNPNYAHLSGEITRLTGVINNLVNARPYEEQRFYWLIAAPRQQRCQNNEDSCITANEAEALRRRMTSQQ